MHFRPLTNAPLAHGPAVEQAIRQFHESGVSLHDVDGVVLAPLLEHLRHNRKPFVLTYMPGSGYRVEAGAPVSEPPAMVAAVPVAHAPPVATEELPDTFQDPARTIGELSRQLEAARDTPYPVRVFSLTKAQYDSIKGYIHLDDDGTEFLMGVPVQVWARV